MKVLTTLLLGAGLLLHVACGSNPTAPTPEEKFALPSGAPATAAAPRGTTRITLTMIDMVANDGSSTPASALKARVHYTARLWIFCPRGLEGTFDYGVIVTNAVDIYAFDGAKLVPGYNSVSEQFAGFFAGSYATVDTSKATIDRRCKTDN